MIKSELSLSVKPSGDCWLHVKTATGKKASLNLGQRGSMNDPSRFIGRVILEVAMENQD